MIKGCILPWMHMFGTIDGKYKVCCFAENQKGVEILGTADQKPTEVWNNPKYKNLRKKFLNGEIPIACQKTCYDKERVGDRSNRQSVNSRFKKWEKLQDITESDGYLKTKPTYLDIRFGNICNFICRMCGPHSSTSWYKETIQKQVTMKGKIQKYTKPIDYFTNNEVFWSDIDNILPYVEEVYFAGGEPFVQDGHYKLITLLIQKDYAKKIVLSYNSNLSYSRYKDFDLLDLWKNFKGVKLWPSCDGFGKKVEYSRKGFEWDTFEKNCKKFHRYIHTISSVISIYSISSMPDLILWTKKNQLSFFGTTLIGPEDLSVTVLPKEAKKIINKQYHTFLNNYSTLFHKSEISNILNWLSYMNSRDDSYLLPRFKTNCSRMDKFRNESFVDIFPEFAEWYEKI